MAKRSSGNSKNDFTNLTAIWKFPPLDEFDVGKCPLFRRVNLVIVGLNFETRPILQCNLKKFHRLFLRAINMVMDGLFDFGIPASSAPSSGSASGPLSGISSP